MTAWTVNAKRSRTATEEEKKKECSRTKQMGIQATKSRGHQGTITKETNAIVLPGRRRGNLSAAGVTRTVLATMERDTIRAPGKHTKGSLGITTPSVARKLMVKYVRS